MWRGDGSSIASATQSNKDARSYLHEVKDMFGADNVSMPADDIGNTIFANKR